MISPLTQLQIAYRDGPDINLAGYPAFAMSDTGYSARPLTEYPASYPTGCQARYRISIPGVVSSQNSSLPLKVLLEGLLHKFSIQYTLY